MPFQNRMMTLVAFLQAQNCSNLPGSWRHPSTMLDFLMPEQYQRIARTLEDGKIEMAFFDDRLALPDLYTGHHAEARSSRNPFGESFPIIWVTGSRPPWSRTQLMR